VTEPHTVSVPEAARLMRVGRDAAYAAVHSGDLKVIRIGRVIRVPMKSIELLMEHASSKGMQL
jgi:excisionase family DNA binding protein